MYLLHSLLYSSKSDDHVDSEVPTSLRFLLGGCLDGRVFAMEGSRIS